MAKYRIIKTIMAKHPVEFFRDEGATPVFLVEKKAWFGWTYIDWWPRQAEAEEYVLLLKGEHPDQIALQELLKQEDVVVREYD